MVRIGIIGTGFGKTVHLPTFRSLSGTDVLAIADSGSGKRITDLEDGVEYFGHWQDLIALPDLTAVSIATPPKSHFEISCAALQRGLHVLCEKPFGVSVVEAAEMKRCAEHAGVVLGVNFQFRFEPGIQVLAKTIREGVIGGLRRLDFAWLTAGRVGREVHWSWQNDSSCGGGVIAGFFSHVADLATWISGREVLSVYGHAHTQIASRVDTSGHRKQVTAEDSLDALMVLTDEITSSVRISNVQPGGGGMVIEASGEDGRLVFMHKQPFMPEDASVTLHTPDGRSLDIKLSYADKNTKPCQDTRFLAMRSSAEEFIRAVRGESPIDRPTAVDAVKAHAVMHALRRALVTGSAIAVEYVREH